MIPRLLLFFLAGVPALSVQGSQVAAKARPGLPVAWIAVAHAQAPALSKALGIDLGQARVQQAFADAMSRTALDLPGLVFELRGKSPEAQQAVIAARAQDIRRALGGHAQSLAAELEIASAAGDSAGVRKARRELADLTVILVALPQEQRGLASSSYEKAVLRLGEKLAASLAGEKSEAGEEETQVQRAGGAVLADPAQPADLAKQELWLENGRLQPSDKAVGQSPARTQSETRRRKAKAALDAYWEELQAAYPEGEPMPAERLRGVLLEAYRRARLTHRPRDLNALAWDFVKRLLAASYLGNAKLAEAVKLVGKPHYARGDYWRVVDHEPDPVGGGVLFKARRKPHARVESKFEDGLLELHQAFPRLAEALGIRGEDGLLIYPDVDGMNARIELLKGTDLEVFVRFWTFYGYDGTGGEGGHRRCAEHWAFGADGQGRAVIRSAGQGIHHHDLGAHMLGYLLLPREVVDILVGYFRVLILIQRSIDAGKISNVRLVADIAHRINSRIEALDTASNYIAEAVLRKEGKAAVSAIAFQISVVAGQFQAGRGLIEKILEESATPQERASRRAQGRSVLYELSEAEIAELRKLQDPTLTGGLSIAEADKQAEAILKKAQGWRGI